MPGAAKTILTYLVISVRTGDCYVNICRKYVAQNLTNRSPSNIFQISDQLESYLQNYHRSRRQLSRRSPIGQTINHLKLRSVLVLGAGSVKSYH